MEFPFCFYAPISISISTLNTLRTHAHTRYYSNYWWCPTEIHDILFRKWNIFSHTTKSNAYLSASWESWLNAAKNAHRLQALTHQNTYTVSSIMLWIVLPDHTPLKTITLSMYLYGQLVTDHMKKKKKKHHSNTNSNFGSIFYLLRHSYKVIASNFTLICIWIGLVWIHSWPTEIPFHRKIKLKICTNFPLTIEHKTHTQIHHIPDGMVNMVFVWCDSGGDLIYSILRQIIPTKTRFQRNISIWKWTTLFALYVSNFR